MPGLPISAKPWNMKASSASAADRAASETLSRSGSSAPREMASSSARDTSNGTRSSTIGRTCRTLTAAPCISLLRGSATRPRLTALDCHPKGPFTSTSFRPASAVVSMNFASCSICSQPSAEMGASSLCR